MIRINITVVNVTMFCAAPVVYLMLLIRFKPENWKALEHSWNILCYWCSCFPFKGTRYMNLLKFIILGLCFHALIIT